MTDVTETIKKKKVKENRTCVDVCTLKRLGPPKLGRDVNVRRVYGSHTSAATAASGCVPCIPYMLILDSQDPLT